MYVCGVLIFARTGCDRNFNIEAQPCFCIFLPAASAAGRKFEPPALQVRVTSIFLDPAAGMD
jgi:hypothetical protein